LIQYRKYEYVLAIHIDKDHIYNHIIFNSIDIDDGKVYHSFGRELNSHFRKDFMIKLPIKMDKKNIVYDENKFYSDEGYIPDWEWMENYIRELPYADKI
jgi:hypothetical protein